MKNKKKLPTTAISTCKMCLICGHKLNQETTKVLKAIKNGKGLLRGIEAEKITKRFNL